MLCSITHIKKPLYHRTHHCRWMALFGCGLFCLLQGFCNIYWISSKCDLEFIPFAQMVPLHGTGWGGRTSSFNLSWGQLRFYVSPTTTLHRILGSNKQKNHNSIQCLWANSVVQGEYSGLFTTAYYSTTSRLGLNACSFCLNDMKLNVCAPTLKHIPRECNS